MLLIPGIGIVNFECFYRFLASFLVNEESQTGYIPDIYRVMRKYGLSEYFKSTLDSRYYLLKGSRNV